MRTVKVIEPGLYTTVQDAGRPGWLRFGLPPSGVMDREAYETANRLIGQDPDAAVLECAGTLPVLECSHSTNAAVVYADRYQVLEATAGERLCFRPIKTGYRAYIALDGGLDVPIIMGSRATYVPARLGGFEGRTLQAGDVLPLSKVDEASSLIAYEPPARSEMGSPVCIDVIPGPEAEWFDCGGLNTFLTEPFLVSSKSDRTGIRLEGSPLSFHSEAQMVSAGLAFGTIQVPPSGLPIIMGADHPATGGYPRIGHVVQADQSKMAQLRPGDTVRFREFKKGV